MRMPENPFQKGSSMRNSMARNIREFRETEKGQAQRSWQGVNREGRSYEKSLFGIDGSFDYVRNWLPPQVHTVLDVGCGRGTAVADLASANPDLRFEGTSLVRYPNHNNLNIPIHITSGEILRGIPTGSIGLTIAAFSTCYGAPALYARAINRVSAEGALIQAGYFTEQTIEDAIYDCGNIMARSHEARLLETQLLRLGYEVIIHQPIQGRPINSRHSFLLEVEPGNTIKFPVRDSSVDILLARKPGGSKNSPSLEEILEANANSYLRGLDQYEQIY